MYYAHVSLYDFLIMNHNYSIISIVISVNASCMSSIKPCSTNSFL